MLMTKQQLHAAIFAFLAYFAYRSLDTVSIPNGILIVVVVLLGIAFFQLGETVSARRRRLRHRIRSLRGKLQRDLRDLEIGRRVLLRYIENGSADEGSQKFTRQFETSSRAVVKTTELLEALDSAEAQLRADDAAFADVEQKLGSHEDEQEKSHRTVKSLREIVAKDLRLAIAQQNLPVPDHSEESADGDVNSNQRSIIRP